VALAICLLFDDRGDRAIRGLWDRLESLGVPTLRSHTHGRHVPHLSYAVLLDGDVDRAREVVGSLPDAGPVDLHFDGLGTFRRGRAWLISAITSDLSMRQERVASVLSAGGSTLHRNYVRGSWLPHCTLAPRVPLSSLPLLAATVYDVLPLDTQADRAALVDSGTGTMYPLALVP
jgi:hypothetical protein